MPLTTLAATVDASGISAPTYDAIYSSLQASYQAIFGTDGYIAPDSQDGQLLAVFAKAISDCNDMAIAVYNNYSPATSQGGGLSAAVKINGIRRRSSSHSTADVTIGGVVGTIISAGIVGDAAGAHQWTLPATVTIPPAGVITVTATCVDDGAIEAVVGTLVKIVTPTLGWQTATNPSEAVPGAPVETDADLRRRQVYASALPANSANGALIAGLSQLIGVTEVALHENFTDATDSDGVPEHSIACIIVGGDVDQIAARIALKKTPGGNTFGTVSVLTTDPNGLPMTVKFSRPTDNIINLVLSVKRFANYATGTTAAIQAALTAYINGLSIGETLDFNRLWVPANLGGSPVAQTFNVTAMTANGGTADIPQAYNQQAVAGTVTVNFV